jgi:MFS family permease
LSSDDIAHPAAAAMLGQAARPPASIETRSSWLVAAAALGIMSMCYGAPLVAVVALKPIAADLGSLRSIAALAGSLAWLGAAVGGIVMARIAERVGVRWTVMSGALMIGAGLALSSQGGVWQLLVGHGLLIGLLGNGGINAPLYVYVSHWFDRRRGTALALISSGQYVAGALWPSLFERAIDRYGWQHTMVFFAALAVVVIVPAAAIFLRSPPEAPAAGVGASGPQPGARVLGFRPGVALALLSLASFCCCVPMAMPQGHLVAFCSDLGILPSHGAAMLSLLLGTAFVSRQCWGWISDRIGGLRTVLAGSACQVAAMVGFLATRNEAGLFMVATAFGLGFSGVIPAYVLAVRQLFPAAEAARRIPVLLLCSGSGMAAGGWLAGMLYDRFGFYEPAFAAGIAFNLVNLALIGVLVARQRDGGGHRAAALSALEAD